ncbi:DUF4263 domain-containing protein [Mycobacterium sp. CBMA271]|uniref:Shedu anti-phage system protein SduA domain-containing protein n=1 Tax=unclassified Mycobacteroides TaxID=2618759 RepID=UPI0012DE6006|nr:MULTISPECIES: Shedu anti-phage system protein SduA domain-containing protein [unclassified Mycobacteroides]MUM17040.1 hypothetical protein [Mycobacteroides sp. CBMA 326]MUM23276.1 DUF4263 domain-containing protein [Mycobacteroides sp. CBMA 271]
MVDDSPIWESMNGPNGSVIAKREGSRLSLSWFNSLFEDHRPPVELVRFDLDTQMLSIFPKLSLWGGTVQCQFRWVRELQIDTSCFEWSPHSPVWDIDREHGLELAGMPKGFGRYFALGLGLLPRYREFVRTIEANSDCKIVRFGSKAKEGAVDDTFMVSFERFGRYIHAVDLNRDRGNVVVNRVNEAEAANAVADLFKNDPVNPTVGRHPIIQAMTRAVTDRVPLNEAERAALVGRMAAEAPRAAVENPQAFGKLRQDIELVALEVLIEQYERGLHGPMSKDEGHWQEFFATNTFALQQLFAAPLALYGSQLALAIPSMFGRGGRVADFVLVNTLTRSAVVVEIKTPASKLLGLRYRGSDGAKVYPPHRDLSGAVAQLQAQMESVVTDFPSLVGKTPHAEPIETASVRGAVIVGSLASLTAEELQSFVRYRNGLHAVEVLTFDEVGGRLKGLHQLLKSPHV